MYKTKSLKNEYRTETLNGESFDKCEHCGVDESKIDCYGIKYYHRYRKVLCDRCVDNKDGATVWSDKYAQERGFPPYRK